MNRLLVLIGGVLILTFIGFGVSVGESRDARRSPDPVDPLDGAIVTVTTPAGESRYRLQSVDEPATNPTTAPSTLPSTVPVIPPSTPPTTTRAVQNAPGNLAWMIPSGMAPTVVHVNALGIKPRNGTILTAKYEWDFGDPRGRFNSLPGWNAAHVYDRAGDYEIKLTVTDEAGEVSIYTQKVPVTANTRRAVYVANGGDDQNIGSDPAKPLRTLQRAFRAVGDDTAILLKRGDRFDVVQPLDIKASNVVVGAYGEFGESVRATTQAAGDRPLIRFVGELKYIPIFRVDEKSSDVLIQDIAFDSIHTKNTEKIGMPDAIKPGGQNFAARNCVFLNLGNAINSNGNPRGVLALDCSAPLPTGLRSYFSWIQGSDHVYLGNVVANTTREHVIRCGGGERLLFAYNDFANLDRRPNDPIDTNKGALTIRKGQFAYVAHNTFRKGQLLFGPLGKEDGLKDMSMRWKYGVAEDNLFLDTFVLVEHGASHLVFRNNQTRINGWFAYEIEGFNEQYSRGNEDITIENNTASNSATRGGFLRLRAKVDGLRVIGNTFSATKLAGKQDAHAVWIAPGDARPFVEITRNTWPVHSLFWMSKEIPFAEFESRTDAKGDRLADIDVHIPSSTQPTQPTR